MSKDKKQWGQNKVSEKGSPQLMSVAWQRDLFLWRNGDVTTIGVFAEVSARFLVGYLPRVAEGVTKIYEKTEAMNEKERKK